MYSAPILYWINANTSKNNSVLINYDSFSLPQIKIILKEIIRG